MPDKEAMLTTIHLSEIWPISKREQEKYKCHLAQSSSDTGWLEPLDVFLRDRTEWLGWQEYRSRPDRFSRQFIFSLIRFYPEGSDTWLFGGIFEVLERSHNGYKVRLTDQLSGFIGRLKLHLEKSGPTTTPKLATYYEKMQVLEILGKPYSGPPFLGYEHIHLSFAELEALIRTNRTDWKTALQNVSGVYMITDTNTGKRYVGSAYGEGGIWSRWGEYVYTGDGGNTELRELAESGLDYPREHFRFMLLEYRATSTPKDVILERETFWKEALLTRYDKYGLNLN